MGELMHVLDIQFRDIFVLFEVGLTDLKKLQFCLDNMELKFDGSKEKEKAAASYLTDVFYKNLVTTIKKIEKEHGITSDTKDK